MRITENIEVLTHSSIRITASEGVFYIDPFQIDQETHDAAYILITHNHFDHFSPEDIARIVTADTVLVVPEGMKEQAEKIPCKEVLTVDTDALLQLGDVRVETIPAYNPLKPFHPRKNNWVGYLLTVDGVRIYIAGDTDITKENSAVSCDVALVPIGGKFTMNAKEAARLVNTIRPKAAIPTHYGNVAGTREDEKEFRDHVDPTISVEIKMQRYR